MRIGPPLVLLLALAAAGPYADAAETARPSDTNNKPATSPSPSPPPGQTPTPSGPPAPPPSSSPPPTPAPAPSTPTPSTNPPPPSSAPPSASPATSEPPATPEPTTAAVVSTTAPPSTPAAAATNTSSSSQEASSGMGAGAIVGIVLACVGLIGIIGFFAYRHFRARREDAQGYGNGDYTGQSPALESSSAQHDAKMYASMDLPKPSRQTTATATPQDDIVIMATYVTPSSPKFTDSAPQISPPPFNHSTSNDHVADFTKSVNTFDQSRGPGASIAAPSDYGNSYREGSYAESYAESYAGGESFAGATSFMNSYDNAGILGGDGFRDTLDEAPSPGPAKKTSPSNGLAGLDANKEDSHWMDAMDEMRDTNDSYAMLEAGDSGSFNSRGSAMRFSTESDLHG